MNNWNAMTLDNTVKSRNFIGCFKIFVIPFNSVYHICLDDLTGLPISVKTHLYHSAVMGKCRYRTLSVLWQMMFYDPMVGMYDIELWTLHSGKAKWGHNQNGIHCNHYWGFLRVHEYPLKLMNWRQMKYEKYIKAIV